MSDRVDEKAVKPPRRRWRRRLGLAAASIPLAWSLLVSVAPTEPARRRIEQALTRELGQPCRLSHVGIDWLGRVSLEGLEVGFEVDPWLRIPRVELGLDLAGLLTGRIAPTIPSYMLATSPDGAGRPRMPACKASATFFMRSPTVES